VDGDLPVAQDERGGRAVGVERGEHQVAGERRLDRRARRLLVARLADQQHVRILPEERAEDRRERQADVGGQPAADNFCKRRRFTGARAFEADPNIGRSEPTRVSGSILNKVIDLTLQF